MELMIFATMAGLILAAVWAALKDLRAASACAAFCVVMLGLVVALERGAAAASRYAADATDRGVAEAMASWSAQNAPASSRVLTFFVEDGIDGDDDSGAGPSWADALRSAAENLTRAGTRPRRLGLELPGSVIDWRTQTLVWASDRDAQYDALAGALAAAKKSGARVQVVARGRGAQTVLAGLRRGAARPDRMLIVGRMPEPGDERLASDLAFVYATPSGAETAYTGADGAFVRVPGKTVDGLLPGVAQALVRDVAFRAATTGRAEALALPISTSIGGTLKPWAR